MGRRKSVFDRLEARADELAPDVAKPAPGAGASPVHTATVDVMADLMRMGSDMSSSSTPAYLRVLMRTLEKSRPMLLESIKDVPPAAIQQFMKQLGDKIQTIVDAPVDDPNVIELEPVDVEDVAAG